MPRSIIEEEIKELLINLSAILQVEIDSLMNKLEYMNIKKTL